MLLQPAVLLSRFANGSDMPLMDKLGCRRRHDLGKGFKPLMIFDTVENKLSPHQSTYWADFYREHRRDPTIIEPAPWVKARLGDLAWK